jgi:glutamyl-tRNA synthetase
MKNEELQYLPDILSKDFRTIEPHLLALDKHLVLRTHLVGYELGDLETKVWQTLKANRAAMGFIRKGSLINLTRWFNYIEQAYPEIQTESKAADAALIAKIQAGSRAGASYNISLPDTEKGVITRFLPEPS